GGNAPTANAAATTRDVPRYEAAGGSPRRVARNMHIAAKINSFLSFSVFSRIFLDLPCCNHQATRWFTAQGGQIESGYGSLAMHRVHGRCFFVRPRGLMRFRPRPGA